MNKGANLLLLVATAAALAVVPDWPHRNLDDPSYWGVIGFVLVVVQLLRRSGRSWSAGSGNRRVVAYFLVGLPLIYVADWLRFGGSGPELGVELAGLALWVSLAWYARGSDLMLWLGCAAHALWDAAHYSRVAFVPDWYVAACIAADVGIGAFVLLSVTANPEPGAS